LDRVAGERLERPEAAAGHIDALLEGAHDRVADGAASREAGPRMPRTLGRGIRRALSCCCCWGVHGLIVRRAVAVNNPANSQSPVACERPPQVWGPRAPSSGLRGALVLHILRRGHAVLAHLTRSIRRLALDG